LEVGIIVDIEPSSTYILFLQRTLLIAVHLIALNTALINDIELVIISSRYFRGLSLARIVG